MRTTTVFAAALLSTTAYAADSKPEKSQAASSEAAAATANSGPARLFSDEAIYAAAQATATSANKALQDYLRIQTAVPASKVFAEQAAWNSAIQNGAESAALPAITALPKSLAQYESQLYAGEKSIIQHDIKSGDVLTGSAASKFIVFATESAPSASKSSGASTLATETGSPSGSAGASSSTSGSAAPKPSSGAEGRGVKGVAVLCMAAVAGLAGLMAMM